MDSQIFGYKEMVKAYNQLALDHAEIMGLAMVMALAFAILNCIREISKKTDGKIDAAAILNLIKANIWTFVIIIFLPLGLGLLENLFGIIEQSYLDQLGDSPKKFMKIDKEEGDKYFKQMSLFKGTGENLYLWVEYLFIAMLKPFLSLVDQWCYSFALFYRFLMLIILQMLSGLAIACTLYEPYKKYFEIWLKTLLVCYLLIPAFMIVTNLVNILGNVVFYDETTTTNVGIMLISIFLKIFGYGKVQQILMRLL